MVREIGDMYGFSEIGNMSLDFHLDSRIDLFISPSQI